MTDRPMSLCRGWGFFAIHPRAATPPPGIGVRSYDSQGYQLSWRPELVNGDAKGSACDIEWRGRTPDTALLELIPKGADFWEFWVLAEVASKLGQVPILEWLRRFRAGQVPRLPLARALLIPRWRGQWTLAFGQMPTRSLHSGPARGAISPWGFPSRQVAVRETATGEYADADRTLDGF